MVPFVAAEFLVLAALGSAWEALLHREWIFGERLTAGDQAATLTAVGLLLRLLFGSPDLLVEGVPTAP